MECNLDTDAAGETFNPIPVASSSYYLIVLPEISKACTFNVQQAQPIHDQLDMELRTILKQQQFERHLQTIDACPRTCTSAGASEHKYVLWFCR